MHAEDLAKEIALHLSRGQRQRVLLAAALLTDPLSMIDLASVPVLRALSWLLPVSSGVGVLQALRATPLDSGRPPSSFLPLVVAALVNLAVGLTTFRRAERRARENGTLTRYN